MVRNHWISPRGCCNSLCLSFNVTPRPTGFTGRIWCRRAIWSQRRHVVMSWCWWHWTCIRPPVLYESRRAKSAIYCPSVLLAKAGERLQELTVITHIWHLGCVQAKQTKTNNKSGDGHNDARASHRRTHSFGKLGSRRVYGSCANSAAPCPHALIGFHDMALESIGCFRWTDGGPVYPWIEALLNCL